MSIILMNINEIIFYDYINESVYNLRRMIKVIERKRNIELKFKKVKNRGIRNIDIIELIDDDKFMIDQLIVKKKKSREYIMKEMI